MVENEINNFDNLIRSKMDGYTPQPPSSVWSGVEQATAGGSTSIISGTLAKVIIGITSIAAISAGVFFYQENSNDTKNPTIEKVQTSASKVSNGQSVNALSETNESVVSNQNDAENSNIKGPNGANKVAAKNNTAQPNNIPERTINISGPIQPSTSHSQVNKTQLASGRQNSVKNEPVLILNTELCMLQNFEIKVANNEGSVFYILVDQEKPIQTSKDGIIYKFNTPGSHKILLLNDKKEVLDSKVIQVSKPEAAFEYKYEASNSIYFEAKSDKYGVNYQWSIGESGLENKNQFTYKFPEINQDSQIIEVKLKVFEGKCFNETVQKVVIYNSKDPVIPTLFTPNHDGLNDNYEVLLNGNKFYSISIYDESDRKVFETFDADKKWDGTYEGENVPAGNYKLKLVYQSNSSALPIQKLELIRLERGAGTTNIK